MVDLPSVPSDRVASFSSSICIWPANPALRSRSCFKFSSSAFFSFIRASRIGDCPAALPVRLPDVVEACRRCDGRGGREEYDMVDENRHKAGRLLIIG
jgi:hypothetical protein